MADELPAGNPSLQRQSGRGRPGRRRGRQAPAAIPLDPRIVREFQRRQAVYEGFHTLVTALWQIERNERARMRRPITAREQEAAQILLEEELGDPEMFDYLVAQLEPEDWRNEFSLGNAVVGGVFVSTVSANRMLRHLWTKHVQHR